MKPLKCSICGYETNAVTDKEIEIICNGCHRLKILGNDETIMSAMRESYNLPKWLRMPENRIGHEIRSYADT